MATMTSAGKLESGLAQIRSHRLSTTRFDWVAALLSSWVIGGAYLDGWAHNHGRVDDVFFTPWHAVLYSGVFVLFLFLLADQWRNRPEGKLWQLALPAGYRLSLLGAALFLAGGGLDLIWHTLFGTEVNLETLLSPTHLLLATSAALMITGPLRAAWARLAPGKPHGWKNLGPAILSMTALWSLLTFFTPYAHPINDPLAEKSAFLDQGKYDDLYVMDASGSRQTRLTTSPDQFAWGGAWSPDGRQIVFSRGEVTKGVNPESALYIMNTDGSQVRKLTDLPGWEYIPAWSPDGTRIAFINNHADRAHVFVINVDGTGLQKLTNADAPDYGPVWSPDSQRIVFVSNASGSDQLYAMNADGTGQRQITNYGSDNWGASWSPDGSQILFNSRRGANMDIYTIHPDGSGERRLTVDGARQLMPSWSPDGSQIAYVSRDDSGTDQIFVMNADGSREHNVTQNHVLREILFPRWSPDGVKIMFSASGHSSIPSPFFTESLAIAGILLQSAIFMGVILLLVKRWQLPFGALIFMVTLNSTLMTIFHDRYEFVLPSFAAGLLVDLLLWRLKPAETRRSQLYLFAFTAPAVFYGLYFLTLQMTKGIGWTIHLWLGSIFLAGIAGLFISFLMVSPFSTESETTVSPQ